MRSVIAETWDILKLQFNERQRQIARLTATSRPSTMTGNAPGGGGGAGAGVIPPTSGTAGTTDFSSATAYTPPTVGDLDSARNPLRPSEEL